MKYGYTDSLELKIFLIYHLLKSIRMDFGEDSALKERRALAIKLTKLAAKEYEDRAAKWAEKHSCRCLKDIEWNADKASKLRELQKEIKGFKPGKTDGRYFRYEFPYGYEGMLEYFWMEEEQ